jgi:enolase
MKTEQPAQKIRSINWRRILNSHVEITNEFKIELENGNVGVGSSPQGETISIYEDKFTPSDPQRIIEEIKHDLHLDHALTQSDFDKFLQHKTKQFGRNNCWALSLAFFNAIHFPLSRFWKNDGHMAKGKFPQLCMNILNGGSHAYTNPVLSDFHEYIIVPKHHDVKRVIRDHAEIQQEIKKGLAQCEKVIVSHNPVHRFKSINNEECLKFLSNTLERLGMREEYDLMIDASAGDLWTGKGYTFSITDGSFRSTSELQKYWMNLIDEYSLGFLEDPFREEDYEGWKMLVSGQSHCKIIGDNLYSSDPGRIELGCRNGYTHGAIIKPNQAGTVTTVQKAIDTLQRNGQLVITSHRSIGTEETFLSNLTVLTGAGYMKIGPLFTDYTSVMRFNELIRLTGVYIG